MNKASGACEALITQLTFVSESQKERRKENRTERVLKEIMHSKLPKTGKTHKCTYAKSWANTKQDKPKEIHGKYIVIKLLQTKDKEKSGKQPEKTDALSREEHPFEWQWISHIKPRKPEGSGTCHFSSTERTEMSMQILHPEKLFFRNEEGKGH